MFAGRHSAMLVRVPRRNLQRRLNKKYERDLNPKLRFIGLKDPLFIFPNLDNRQYIQQVP